VTISPQVKPVVTGQGAAPQPAHARSGSSAGAVGRRETSSYIRLVRVGDTVLGLAALVGGFLAANLGRMPAGADEFLEMRLTVRNLLLLVAFLVLWRVLCGWAGLYDPARIRRRRSELARVALVCSIGTAAAMTFPLISLTGAFSPLAVLYFGITATCGLLLLRVLLRTVTDTAGSAVREVLIVGSGPRAWKAYQNLQADPHVISRLLGFVDVDDNLAPPEVRRHWAGSLSDLEYILMRQEMDEVLIALPIRSQYGEIQRAIETCWRLGIRCRYLADVFDHGRSTPRFEEGGGLRTVAMAVVAEDERLILKRAIDIVCAVVALVVSAPLLAAAAVAVKLSSPGPVLFSQPRHGLHKRRFRMYKLRTMYVDAEARQTDLEDRNEASGPVFKIRDDPRITPVGRILRRTSIDELPQLWNVLRGDMSIVGPRPLPVRDVQRFTEGALMRRFSVRPGVTGLWQVSARSTLNFEDWVRLDMQYIDEWSLALDIRILAMTLPAVVRGSGAA
jgi:exopolysaccharide biosynthesis polyprenyl glycosylphosphotransferase